jgi:hypothetical protein
LAISGFCGRMPMVAEAYAAVPSLFISPTHWGMGRCALRRTIGGVFNFTLALDEVLGRAMNEVIVLMRWVS